jgi:transposase-like protein
MSIVRSVSFVGVTDKLASNGVSLGDVAERFGVRRETVSRWRREGATFSPPANWRDVLADLAEERGRVLRDVAKELRGVE